MKRLDHLTGGVLACALVVCGGATAVAAPGEVLADSEAQFSATQGQDGWSYGYWESAAGEAYDHETFQLLPNFAPGKIPGSRSWRQAEAWYLLNGAGDSTRIGSKRMKPTALPGKPQQWPVRRWVASRGGTVTVSGLLADAHVNARDGRRPDNGVVGRIYIDGEEVWSGHVGPTHKKRAFAVEALVRVGQRIDLVVDPLDGNQFYDDTSFTARIVERDIARPEYRSAASPGRLGSFAAGFGGADWRYGYVDRVGGGGFEALAFSENGTYCARAGVFPTSVGVGWLRPGSVVADEGWLPADHEVIARFVSPRDGVLRLSGTCRGPGGEDGEADAVAQFEVRCGASVVLRKAIRMGDTRGWDFVAEVPVDLGGPVDFCVSSVDGRSFPVNVDVEVFAGRSAQAASLPEATMVGIAEVRGDLGDGVTSLGVVRLLREAREAGVDTLVLHLDCGGGAFEETVELAAAFEEHRDALKYVLAVERLEGTANWLLGISETRLLLDGDGAALRRGPRRAVAGRERGVLALAALGESRGVDPVAIHALTEPSAQLAVLVSGEQPPSLVARVPLGALKGHGCMSVAWPGSGLRLSGYEAGVLGLGAAVESLDQIGRLLGVPRSEWVDLRAPHWLAIEAKRSRSRLEQAEARMNAKANASADRVARVDEQLEVLLRELRVSLHSIRKSDPRTREYGRMVSGRFTPDGKDAWASGCDRTIAAWLRVVGIVSRIDGLQTKRARIVGDTLGLEVDLQEVESVADKEVRWLRAKRNAVSPDGILKPGYTVPLNY